MAHKRADFFVFVSGVEPNENITRSRDIVSKGHAFDVIPRSEEVDLITFKWFDKKIPFISNSIRKFIYKDEYS